MSALTPHIKVLRAEAYALTAEARRALDSTQVALDAGNTALVTAEATAATILVRLSEAKLEAATALEAQEAALQPPTEGSDKPVNYDPKGKP